MKKIISVYYLNFKGKSDLSNTDQGTSIVTRSKQLPPLRIQVSDDDSDGDSDFKIDSKMNGKKR